MAIKEKNYPSRKGVSEDRLLEVELMIMNDEPIDMAKWGREVEALAKTYPEEFGYLLEKKD